MTDGSNKTALSEALPAVRALMAQTLRQADASFTGIMDLLAQENGKNFRARLLLAAAADPTGAVPREAITTAAAIEILHLATLVHDDIIDDSPTRRGQPSVQSRFGKRAAVLGGDYLFCLCLTLIADISSRYPERTRDFTRAMTGVCVGEMRQNQHLGNTDLGIFSYLRTIGGKTAALFSLALYAGGILGGRSEAQSRVLAHIGLDIGMQFQLADDCLDYEASAATIRKSVRHDLREGVITLPLILAFAADPSLKDQVGGRLLTTADIDAISAAVLRLGGVAATKQVADRYAAKARQKILRLSEPHLQGRLTELLEQLLGRSN